MFTYEQTMHAKKIKKALATASKKVAASKKAVTVLLKHDSGKRLRNKKAGNTLCFRCEGTGNQWKTEHKTCNVCNGTGHLEKTK